MKIDIRRYKELPSTNDEAMRLALDGAQSFTVVAADSQSRGRGRNGRDWFSPAGTGLYASLVTRPAVSVSEISLMTLLCGVSAVEAIRRTCGLKASLKWPNDVLVNKRKVAGILCEASLTSKSDPIVIIGLGVNVNTLPQDLPERTIFPGTSLMAESGLSHNRDELLLEWVERTGFWLEKLESGNTAQVIRRWNEFDALHGARVSVSQPDGTRLSGTAAGVDDEGHLILRLHGGEIEKVIVGDVEFES